MHLLGEFGSVLTLLLLEHVHVLGEHGLELLLLLPLLLQLSLECLGLLGTLLLGLDEA